MRSETWPYMLPLTGGPQGDLCEWVSVGLFFQCVCTIQFLSHSVSENVCFTVTWNVRGNHHLEILSFYVAWLVLLLTITPWWIRGIGPNMRSLINMIIWGVTSPCNLIPANWDFSHQSRMPSLMSAAAFTLWSVTSSRSLAWLTCSIPSGQCWAGHSSWFMHTE